jgi:transcription elongation factor Elf1
MGKKKSSIAAVKKERPKLDKVFPCPICGGHSTVSCKFDRDRGIATVECSECRNKYQVDKITVLDEPVDIYAQWIDACEEENS